MKKTGIDDLANHMFEAIEMLKNNNDSQASANEKIDVETAKAIASLGKVVIDGYKVKAQVLGMLKNADNPSAIKSIGIQSGIISENENN